MTGIHRGEAGRRAIAQRYRERLARWEVPAEQRTVATRHGETFVVSAGPAAAPPVLALHGAGSNSALWLGDAARWARGRRVHLVDLLGEPGFSAPTRLPWDSGLTAEWLDDVLDVLGVARTALVGNSLGSWTALDYTLRRPARVERLALIAPAGIGRQRTRVLLAGAALAPLGRRGTLLTLRYALGPARLPGEVVDYLLTLHTGYRPRRDVLPVFDDDALRTLRLPLLAIAGARDRMLDTAGTARRLADLVPHATVTVLPGTGHAVTTAGPAVDRFLREGLGD